MQTGTGGFTNCIQMPDVGPPIQIGMYTTAGIMGGGNNGYRFACYIHAIVLASLVDIRETLADEFRLESGKVKINTGVTTVDHLLVNGARYDVTRRQ